MRDTVIVVTARTAVGKAYRGAFNASQGPVLAAHAIRAHCLGSRWDGGRRSTRFHARLRTDAGHQRHQCCAARHLRCRSSMSCAHRYHRPAMRIRPVCHRDGRKPKSGPATTVMLAEVHGRIAGICLYFPMYSSWLGESGLYIQDLFVHEEFRSARIGEKLLRQF